MYVHGLNIEDLSDIRCYIIEVSRSGDKITVIKVKLNLFSGIIPPKKDSIFMFDSIQMKRVVNTLSEAEKCLVRAVFKWVKEKYHI